MAPFKSTAEVVSPNPIPSASLLTLEMLRKTVDNCDTTTLCLAIRFPPPKTFSKCEGPTVPMPILSDRLYT